jgi:hypothetical protein
MAVTVPIIFDKPITFWLGIVLMFALLATLAMGGLVKKGRVSVKYHILAASITIIVAAIHAIYGILTWI